jgi:hypothetical protein
MATTLHPLIQRQPHPFPYHEPLSEEILEDKGKMVTDNVFLIIINIFNMAGFYLASILQEACIATCFLIHSGPH